MEREGFISSQDRPGVAKSSESGHQGEGLSVIILVWRLDDVGMGMDMNWYGSSFCIDQINLVLGIFNVWDNGRNWIVG